jgi:hypothetical protein
MRKGAALFFQSAQAISYTGQDKGIKSGLIINRLGLNNLKFPDGILFS